MRPTVSVTRTSTASYSTDGQRVGSPRRIRHEPLPPGPDPRPRAAGKRRAPGDPVPGGTGERAPGLDGLPPRRTAQPVQRPALRPAVGPRGRTRVAAAFLRPGCAASAAVRRHPDHAAPAVDLD